MLVTQHDSQLCVSRLKGFYEEEEEEEKYDLLLFEMLRLAAQTSCRGSYCNQRADLCIHN